MEQFLFFQWMVHAIKILLKLNLQKKHIYFVRWNCILLHEDIDIYQYIYLVLNRSNSKRACWFVGREKTTN